MLLLQLRLQAVGEGSEDPELALILLHLSLEGGPNWEVGTGLRVAVPVSVEPLQLGEPVEVRNQDSVGSLHVLFHEGNVGTLQLEVRGFEGRNGGEDRRDQVVRRFSDLGRGQRRRFGWGSLGRISSDLGLRRRGRWR